MSPPGVAHRSAATVVATRPIAGRLWRSRVAQTVMGYLWKIARRRRLAADGRALPTVGDLVRQKTTHTGLWPVLGPPAGALRKRPLTEFAEKRRVRWERRLPVAYLFVRRGNRRRTSRLATSATAADTAPVSREHSLPRERPSRPESYRNSSEKLKDQLEPERKIRATRRYAGSALRVRWAKLKGKFPTLRKRPVTHRLPSRTTPNRHSPKQYPL